MYNNVINKTPLSPTILSRNKLPGLIWHMFFWNYFISLKTLFELRHFILELANFTISECSGPSNDHNKVGDSRHFERTPWPHKTRGLRHQQPHIRRDTIPVPGRPEFPFPVYRDRGSRSGPLHSGLTNTVTVVYLADASSVFRFLLTSVFHSLDRLSIALNLKFCRRDSLIFLLMLHLHSTKVCVLYSQSTLLLV